MDYSKMGTPPKPSPAPRHKTERGAPGKKAAPKAELLARLKKAAEKR